MPCVLGDDDQLPWLQGVSDLTAIHEKYEGCFAIAEKNDIVAVWMPLPFAVARVVDDDDGAIPIGRQLGEPARCIRIGPSVRQERELLELCAQRYGCRSAHLA